MLTAPPDPHPLDFDWRFTETTIASICSILPESELGVCVGTPSVARALERAGRPCLLVDRQPEQAVQNQRVLNVDFIPNLNLKLCWALADPPWYPEELENWISLTSSLLSNGGDLFVSVWPESTRPGAKSELEDLFSRIGTWARIEREILKLNYIQPEFERRALEASGLFGDRLSPMVGELIRIVPYSSPPQVSAKPYKHTWTRYILNNYQIAIKSTEGGSGLPYVRMHPHCAEWVWPSVSRRANHRDEIGIWSSENEVGVVDNPIRLIQLLEEYFADPSRLRGKDREVLAVLLDSWSIPKPPFERFVKWSHQE